MKLEKAARRDASRRKARHGMRVVGKSVFVCAKALIKRAEKLST